MNTKALSITYCVLMALFSIESQATVPDRLITIIVSDVKTHMADHPRFSQKLFAVDLENSNHSGANELALWYVQELESYLASVPGLRILLNRPGFVGGSFI